MGWLGNLLGTDKAINNIVDKDNGLIVRAGTALGNLHYSDQEKAGDDKETREWAIRYLEAMAPFKVVQRIIAFAVLGVWSLVALNLVASIWVYELTKKLMEVNAESVWVGIDARQDLYNLATSDYIFYPTVLVLSLYMSGGVAKYFSKSSS